LFKNSGRDLFAATALHALMDKVSTFEAATPGAFGSKGSSLTV